MKYTNMSHVPLQSAVRLSRTNRNFSGPVTEEVKSFQLCSTRYQSYLIFFKANNANSVWCFDFLKHSCGIKVEINFLSFWLIFRNKQKWLTKFSKLVATYRLNPALSKKTNRLYFSLRHLCRLCFCTGVLRSHHRIASRSGLDFGVSTSPWFFNHPVVGVLLCSLSLSC